MSLREAAQQALEALEGRAVNRYMERLDETIAALKAALSEPEQEPMAYVSGSYAGHFTVVPTNPALVLTTGMALYSHPPQRKPLTDEEIELLAVKHAPPIDPAFAQHDDFIEFARAIERAHGIGGEA
jgi:hypothetical protein